MAGKSWQPSHEPHAEGKKGTRYTDIIYTLETREGRRNNPETSFEGRTALQRTHEGFTGMWTTEDR